MTSLIPYIQVAIRRHAHDLEGIGETELANDLLVWAKALTNQVQSEPSPKPHNPDGLTPEQVGVSNGWRLLDEDEIQTSATFVDHIISCRLSSGAWGSLWYNGTDFENTYRTQLTREQLAEARKGQNATT